MTHERLAELRRSASLFAQAGSKYAYSRPGYKALWLDPQDTLDLLDEIARLTSILEGRTFVIEPGGQQQEIERLKRQVETAREKLTDAKFAQVYDLDFNAAAHLREILAAIERAGGERT